MDYGLRCHQVSVYLRCLLVSECKTTLSLPYVSDVFFVAAHDYLFTSDPEHER